MKSGMKEPLTVLLITVFLVSIIATLFTLGLHYPERRAITNPESEYDTSFWNITEATSLPLNVNNITTIIEDYDAHTEVIPIVEWYFSYESETFQGETVRINSVVLRRENTSEPSPTILFLHGYGESYSGHVVMLRELAASGFVVMGIDHPGSGNSTGFPELTPHTFLNVTNGPQDSSLYHSVWAGARAMTLLDSLSYVNDDAIVVSGNSMGAMTTFILSAIDPRVDGAVPMIAAGNLLNSIMSGSLINSVVEPSYIIDSDEMRNLIKWFDPIAYARILTQPTLMLFGSSDEFFPAISMKDTVEAINAPLTLSILPDWGHGVHESWSRIIAKWMNNQYLDGYLLPSVDVSFNEQITLQGGIISVSANVTDASKVWLCWRSGEPGAVWSISEMKESNEGNSDIYSSAIIPWTIGKVSFFVIVAQEDSIQFSSAIHTGNAGSVLFPLLLVLSSLSLLILIKKGEWRLSKEVLAREAPYSLGMFMIGSGFVLPFAAIEGRATLSVLEIIEMFGNTFHLSGWFLPFFFTSICFVLALSAYRHRVQFRVAGMLWTPMLIVLIILFIILSAVFGFFGSLVLVNIGPGGPVFLAGIILMLILDKIVRKKLESRIKHIRERISELEVAEALYELAASGLKRKSLRESLDNIEECIEIYQEFVSRWKIESYKKALSEARRLRRKILRAM